MYLLWAEGEGEWAVLLLMGHVWLCGFLGVWVWRNLFKERCSFFSWNGAPPIIRKTNGVILRQLTTRPKMDGAEELQG